MQRARWLPLVLCALIAACGRRTREVREAFRWQQQLPPGGTLHVRNLNGGIRVVPSNDGSVLVTASTRWRRGRADDIHFMQNVSGNDAYVCAVWGRGGRCDAGGYRTRSASRDWWRMFSLFNRGSDASAEITVALPSGLHVDALTTLGVIRVDGATSGVRARTVNGPIVIANSAGSAIAETVNGNIAVALDSIGASDTIRLETVNGTVKAEVAGNVDGDVQLSTVNGHISTDFPVTLSGEVSRREMHGHIGSSSRPIVLGTTNGSVSLLRRSSSAESAGDGAAAPVVGKPQAAPKR